MRYAIFLALWVSGAVLRSYLILSIAGGIFICYGIWVGTKICKKIHEREDAEIQLLEMVRRQAEVSKSNTDHIVRIDQTVRDFTAPIKENGES